jgi:hypothetical protein
MGKKKEVDTTTLTEKSEPDILHGLDGPARRRVLADMAVERKRQVQTEIAVSLSGATRLHAAAKNVLTFETVAPRWEDDVTSGLSNRLAAVARERGDGS